MDEGARILYRSSRDQVGPELTGKIILGIDLQCLRDVDAAVSLFGRVVQFTERGMAGSGIVPSVGTFLCLAAQHLMNLDFELGVKLFEDGGECHAHNAGADQDDIRFARNC